MSGLAKAIDVSNWQPTNLSALIDEYKVDHVVVRGYLPWERPSNDIAKAQIASARRKGKTAGMYFWAYRANDPRETVRAAKAVMAECGVDGILWLDCETYVIDQVVEDLGPDAAWLREASEEAKALGVRPGIYSGRWWLEAFMPGYQEFANWWLWLAEYNGIADLASVALPAGWESDKLLGHQYAGGAIDLNVFDVRAIEKG